MGVLGQEVEDVLLVGCQLLHAAGVRAKGVRARKRYSVRISVIQSA